jgi:hypothetical protein
VGRAVLILVVAVLMVATAGCGGEDVARTIDPVAQAADRTVAAGGARIEGGGKFRGGGIEVPMTIDGACDFDDRRTSLSLDVPPNAALRPHEAAEAGFPMELVLDAGETVYYASADMRRKLPPGKDWAKVDLGELDDETGLAFQQLNRYDETNPVEWLRLLRTSGDARRVGAERVNGVRTIHYRATIDLRSYPETLAEDEREKARETIERLSKIDPTSVEPMPVSVWIDEDGLVRRERVTIDQLVDGVRTRGHLTFDFVEFGRDVNVEVPDDDETIDVTDQAVEQLESE